MIDGVKQGVVRRYRYEVIKLFADLDPVGLIAIGAPQDEYAPEVDDLLERTQPVSKSQVQDVFLLSGLIRAKAVSLI
jgi:hypothetical protein